MAINGQFVEDVFSLMECRNKLFMSANTRDIIEFYDSFSDRNSLIEWIQERPKGRIEIKEINGEEEIIL